MSGNYDVTVTEADGTERQFIVPYSSLPMMLRPGGWKYELTGGRYNGSYTYSSRNADFMLLTGVYGLPNDITVYGGYYYLKIIVLPAEGRGYHWVILVLFLLTSLTLQPVLSKKVARLDNLTACGTQKVCYQQEHPSI